MQVVSKAERSNCNLNIDCRFGGCLKILVWHNIDEKYIRSSSERIDPIYLDPVTAVPVTVVDDGILHGSALVEHQCSRHKVVSCSRLNNLCAIPPDRLRKGPTLSF